MNIYKITNITNTLEKRNPNYNRVLKIEYIDEMMRKYVSLKPGKDLYVKGNKPPFMVNKLRIDGLVYVTTVKDIDIEEEKKEKTKVTPQKKTQKKPTKNKDTKKNKTQKKHKDEPKKDEVEKKYEE